MPWRATDLMSQVTHITSNTDAPLTMSSREIAKLTKKRHDNVMNDIKKMLTDIEVHAPDFLGTYQTDRGNTYWCYNLPRRETDILLTGYSVPLRAKVIDRWRELEAQVAKPAFAVPTTFAEALRLAGELEEQRVALTHQVGIQAEKIAEDKPKVEYHDAVKASAKCQTMLEVANKYGIGRSKLFKFLREREVLRDAECSPPYQRFIDSGHFEVDPKFFKKNGEFVHYTQTMVTGKGEIYIGKLLRKAGLVGTGE